MINYFLAFVGRIGTIDEMNTEAIFIFNDVLDQFTHIMKLRVVNALPRNQFCKSASFNPKAAIPRRLHSTNMPQLKSSTKAEINVRTGSRLYDMLLLNSRNMQDQCLIKYSHTIDVISYSIFEIAQNCPPLRL